MTNLYFDNIDILRVFKPSDNIAILKNKSNNRIGRKRFQCQDISQILPIKLFWKFLQKKTEPIHLLHIMKYLAFKYIEIKFNRKKLNVLSILNVQKV